jgi:hypothetical protein
MTALVVFVSCAYALIMLYFHYYVWIGIGFI